MDRFGMPLSVGKRQKLFLKNWLKLYTGRSFEFHLSNCKHKRKILIAEFVNYMRNRQTEFHRLKFRMCLHSKFKFVKFSLSRRWFLAYFLKFVKKTIFADSLKKRPAKSHCFFLGSISPEKENLLLITNPWQHIRLFHTQKKTTSPVWK